MSLLGTKVGVISLGICCQTSYQIELHAKLIADMCGDPDAEISRFPFDNIICPLDAAGRILSADRFHPESIEELTLDKAGYWQRMGVHFWHAFQPASSGFLWRRRTNPVESFRALTERFEHTAAKFRRLASVPRLIFVISNAQNNLDVVAQVTGDLDMVLDLALADQLADQTDAYFGRRCEYVVAGYRDRVAGRSRRDNVLVHELSPDGSEWRGDPLQWAALFRKALAPKSSSS